MHSSPALGWRWPPRLWQLLLLHTNHLCSPPGRDVTLSCSVQLEGPWQGYLGPEVSQGLSNFFFFFKTLFWEVWCSQSNFFFGLRPTSSFPEHGAGFEAHFERKLCWLGLLLEGFQPPLRPVISGNLWLCLSELPAIQKYFTRQIEFWPLFYCECCASLLRCPLLLHGGK